MVTLLTIDRSMCVRDVDSTELIAHRPWDPQHGGLYADASRQVLTCADGDFANACPQFFDAAGLQKNFPGYAVRILGQG